MKKLIEYINEQLEYINEQHLGELSPIFKDRFAGSSAVLCPIHVFKERLELDKPIVGGNWNPNEFTTKELFYSFYEWVEKEWPAALQDGHEDELWCMEGTTYERDIDKEDRETLDVYEILNLLEEKLGEPYSHGVRGKCFGKFGLGSKYTYSYYFGKGKGGLILKGGYLPNRGKGPVEKIITFVLFLDSDTFNSLGFQVDDKTQSIEEMDNAVINNGIDKDKE